MTQQEAAAAATSTVPVPDAEPENESSRRWTLERIVRFSVIGIIGVVLIIFLIGLIAALINPQGASVFFAYLRNLFLIVLSIQGILIVTAIGVLIIQVARFVNLLRSEVKPITDDTREAVNNVRVTTHVVRKQALEPVIVLQGFFVGLVAFLREFFRIRRLIRVPQRDDDASEDKDT